MDILILNLICILIDTSSKEMLCEFAAKIMKPQQYS